MAATCCSTLPRSADESNLRLYNACAVGARGKASCGEGRGRGVVWRKGREQEAKGVGRGAEEGAKATRKARGVEHTQDISCKRGRERVSWQPSVRSRASERVKTRKIVTLVWTKEGGGRAEGPDYRRFFTRYSWRTLGSWIRGLWPLCRWCQPLGCPRLHCLPLFGASPGEGLSVVGGEVGVGGRECGVGDVGLGWGRGGGHVRTIQILEYGVVQRGAHICTKIHAYY